MQTYAPSKLPGHISALSSPLTFQTPLLLHLFFRRQTLRGLSGAGPGPVLGVGITIPFPQMRNNERGSLKAKINLLLKVIRLGRDYSP